jgi:hypothetical protein
MRWTSVAAIGVADGGRLDGVGNTDVESAVLAGRRDRSGST